MIFTINFGYMIKCKNIYRVCSKIVLSLLVLYSLRPITNETFFFLVCPIKNETFLKIETLLSILFLFSYFTLSSLTHKITLHKILCQKANVVYFMGRREYILVIKCKLLYCTNSKLFNIVSTQCQYNVKFQDFDVNTISTQHQPLTLCWHFLLLLFYHLLIFSNVPNYSLYHIWSLHLITFSSYNINAPLYAYIIMKPYSSYDKILLKSKMRKIKLKNSWRLHFDRFELLFEIHTT